MSLELNSADKPNKNWLSWQCSSRNQKTNFRSIIYRHSSANPANLVEIDPVDVEINDLKVVVKNKKQCYDTAKHTAHRGCYAGRAKLSDKYNILRSDFQNRYRDGTLP